MTIWEMIRALVRYWPIVLAGALFTAGAGLFAVSDKGVYFTRTDIILHAPANAEAPNLIVTQLENVIITAGVVEKRVSGPSKPIKFASPDVTLAGIGVRNGWSLRLRDTGGQWATNFATQVLVLDVVGPSPEVVEERQAALVGQIRQELYRLQRDARVDPVNDIGAIASPESPVIRHVAGNRPRALGMTALVGIGITLAVVLTVDRIRRRRELAAESLKAAAAQHAPAVS